MSQPRPTGIEKQVKQFAEAAREIVMPSQSDTGRSAARQADFHGDNAFANPTVSRRSFTEKQEKPADTIYPEALI